MNYNRLLNLSVQDPRKKKKKRDLFAPTEPIHEDRGFVKMEPDPDVRAGALPNRVEIPQTEPEQDGLPIIENGKVIDVYRGDRDPLTGQRGITEAAQEGAQRTMDVDPLTGQLAAEGAQEGAQRVIEAQRTMDVDPNQRLVDSSQTGLSQGILPQGKAPLASDYDPRLDPRRNRQLGFPDPNEQTAEEPISIPGADTSMRPRIVGQEGPQGFENTAPGVMDPVPESITAEGIMNKRKELANSPVTRRNGFFDRLIRGMSQGAQEWQQNGGRGGVEGLLGSIAGGGGFSAASPNYLGNLEREDELAELDQDYARQAADEQFQTAQRRTQQQIESQRNADIIRDKEAARREREGQERDKWRQQETKRKIKDREARTRNQEAGRVFNQWRNLDNFDPKDPKMAELATAMQKYGIPITAKDQDKRIQMQQDPRTGDWFALVTDKKTGNTQARYATKDGKRFSTTSKQRYSADVSDQKIMKVENIKDVRFARQTLEEIKRMAPGDTDAVRRFLETLPPEVSSKLNVQ